jgi:tetratricopeptide (TPR) repeat protein
MRILVGHTNQIPQVRDGLPLPTREDREDRILAFGNGYQQVQHEPGMAWTDLLASCPPGWKPDVYIHWSPEYNAVPQGLEQADCLTVGVFGDWNLGGHAIRHISGIFDVLVADGAGSELLRQAGHTNVHCARLWAYDPDLHRRDAAIERDIDILMIGNFNHAIHAGRSRLLAKVARLSARYRVVFTSGVHGEEYTRMMNRALIVFNHSVGGGINMRAYEAPACGALLFNEAASTEIRAIFTDRVDCVLYDEDNLESLLDYYLDPVHTREREAIAQAGWERVQAHSYAHHFAGLLTQLEPMLTRFQRNPHKAMAQRAFNKLSEHEQSLNMAAHWVRTSEKSIYSRLEPLLQAATQGKTAAQQADVVALAAVMLGKWAEVSPSPARECTFADAIALAQRAVTLEPDYALGICNLAYLYIAVQQVGAAERLLRRAAQMLEAPTLRAEQLRGDHFPQGYNYYHMESERIWGRITPGSDEWREELRMALRCRIAMTLAEIAFGRKQFSVAVQHSLAAVAIAPAVAKAHYGLGAAYRALGQRQEAARAYRQAIDLSPFLLEAWRDLAQLYLDLNRPIAAQALMDDLAAMLDGCPIYNSVRADYDRLRAESRERAAGQAQTADDAGAPISLEPTTDHRPPKAPKRSVAADRCLRLLALPDWDDAGSWQPLLRDYVGRYSPGDPITLLLPVEPERYPSVEPVVTDIARFLETCLHTTLEAIPDVILLTEPRGSAQHWTQTPYADALVLLDGETRTATALPAALPTLTLEQLGQAHDLLRSKR